MMSRSNASVPPHDGSETPGLATFANLSASNRSLGQGVDRILDQSEEPEERRMWNMVYGVRDDCVALLQLFEVRESLRFQDFAACWREMRFSHMLSGRPVIAERVEYLQKLVSVGVRLFAAGQDITRKVGALYLLYGIYMKLGRAERTVISIRITPNVWMELKGVRQQTVMQNHHDALFVIDKLLFMSAFSFVANELELAPDLVYRAARHNLGDSEDEDIEEENPLQEYLDDGGLQQLSTLHNKYEAIKQQVFKGAASRRLPSLGPDLVPGISDRLDAVAKGKQPVNRPPEDQPTEHTTLTGREGARARAFAQYRQQPKPEPDERQRSSSSENDTSPLPPLPAKRGRGRGSQEGGSASRSVRVASRGSFGSQGATAAARGRGRGRGRDRASGRDGQS